MLGLHGRRYVRCARVSVPSRLLTSVQFDVPEGLLLDEDAKPVTRVELAPTDVAAAVLALVLCSNEVLSNHGNFTVNNLVGSDQTRRAQSLRTGLSACQPDSQVHASVPRLSAADCLPGGHGHPATCRPQELPSSGSAVGGAPRVRRVLVSAVLRLLCRVSTRRTLQTDPWWAHGL